MNGFSQKKSKKIFFIIPYLNKLGGTERVDTILANRFSDKYEVSIISRKLSEKSLNAFNLNDAVNDIRLSGNNFIFIRKCNNYVLQNTPDIVIIHTMSKLTPVLLINGIKAKNIWSLEHISFGSHNITFRLLRYIYYKKLDKVITLTEDDAKSYDFIADKVSTIANINSLRIRRSKYVSEPKIIISIGRLTYQKGYDLLIDAWSLVENNYPNWSLHIYGEGEDRDKLEKMITCKSLKNISLKGTTNDVQSIYDDASVYVMSSRFEGFGMVLIEAQSRGLPIVSFDCPSGPADIIQDNVNGYLVENGNIDMLADRISDLIENEALRRKFSNEALLSAKRFEPEKIISQWMNLIETAVSK